MTAAVRSYGCMPGVRGRDDSFEEAFDDLLGRALAAARRILGDIPRAEDVAAEALARTYARWDKVRDLPYREAWVVRVAANLAIDVLRKRQAVVPERFVRSTEDSSVDRLAVLAAVRRLPRRQREVIVLAYLSDVAEADVARVLGISSGTVKTHLHRGLAALRKAMSVDLEGEARFVAAD
jgi:RNA polymerase sigma-70 factor, ECF subfamily